MTGASANGRAAKPFDLEAASRAAATEASSTPFAFTYKGTDYAMPPSREWSVAALGALAAGDLPGALADLLGDDYAGLMAAGLNLGELETLFEAVAEASGLTSLPNSARPALPVSTRT